MRTTVTQLLGYTVQTQSGQVLGRVTECEVDLDTHQIVHYRTTSGVFRKTHVLIAPQQILKITTDTFIVDDLVAKDQGQSTPATTKPKTVSAAFRSEE